MKLSDRQIKAMESGGIPEYMRGGIVRYYENGRPPGNFLSAIINNDLAGAVGGADETNGKLLKNYVMWFYNHAPSGTWGYKDAVDDYLNAHYQRFKDSA